VAETQPSLAIESEPPPSEFDRMYEGRPPWDIGRPQLEVLRLLEDGEFVGTVLDAGCGTGEHALELARRGFRTSGVDSSPTAIRIARTKAAERGLRPEFQVADALRLETLGRRFDTVLDCGLFHVFDDDDRRRYVDSLGTVLNPGGRYLLLCFSDSEPRGGGPRRVSELEIRQSFRSGWTIERLRPARFETNLPGFTARAWSARLTRVDSGLSALPR
jgi:SAM-dependent methyltransferase